MTDAVVGGVPIAADTVAVTGGTTVVTTGGAITASR
jgi:hypothetical protein